MAKVHFAPNCVIKYVGAKAKEFSHSLARPRPTLKKGDFVVVDKKTAFNLVHKGFGEFEEVKELSFVKKDLETASEIEQYKADIEQLRGEIKALEELNVSLLKTIDEYESFDKQENENKDENESENK